MSSLQDTVSVARQAWDSNYSLGDKRWRLKQLHGLHKMLVTYCQIFVSSLAEGQSFFRCTTSWTKQLTDATRTDQGVPAIVYEHEIALLIQDICRHLSQLKSAAPEDLKRLNAVAQRPWGVTLIICGCPNLIRFALAPLAGAVAAGNVVILATAASNDNTIISSLAREWSNCFDPDSVFLVPSVDTSLPLPEGIDQTFIFGMADSYAPERNFVVDLFTVTDTSHTEYSSILTSPTAHFYSSFRGYSFAIVDEGTKDWHKIAQEILANSLSQRLLSDRLSTVFVRWEDMDNLRKALRADATPMPNGESLASNNHLQALGFHAWSREIFASQTSSSNLTGPRSKFGLAECLEPAQAAGLLLIIGVSSLDEALDKLIATSDPIAQVAILSPSSEKIAPYVLKWVNASLVSLGHICPILLPGEII